MLLHRLKTTIVFVSIGSTWSQITYSSFADESPTTAPTSSPTFLEATDAPIPFWSSSGSEEIYYADVGELVTLTIGTGSAAYVNFSGNTAEWLALSVQQCPSALDSRSLLYGGTLFSSDRTCDVVKIREEGDEEDEGVPSGCTFDWVTVGGYTSLTVDNETFLDPADWGLRVNNRGDSVATLDVAVFSSYLGPPQGLIESVYNGEYLSDAFDAVDITSSTVNNTVTIEVDFMSTVAYCETYDCSITGYITPYDGGLPEFCEVEDGEEVFRDSFSGSSYSRSTDLPEGQNWVLSVMMAADTDPNSTTAKFGVDDFILLRTVAELEGLAETGLNEDSSAISAVNLRWLATVMSILGAALSTVTSSLAFERG